MSATCNESKILIVLYRRTVSFGLYRTTRTTPKSLGRRAGSRSRNPPSKPSRRPMRMPKSLPRLRRRHRRRRVWWTTHDRAVDRRYLVKRVYVVAYFTRVLTMHPSIPITPSRYRHNNKVARGAGVNASTTTLRIKVHWLCGAQVSDLLFNCGFATCDGRGEAFGLGDDHTCNGMDSSIINRMLSLSM